MPSELDSKISVTEEEFHIRILGRMLEHLGVQMYKRRDAAIAELVANCWDAGASRVWVEVPSQENYNPTSSVIIIEDDGCGMDKEDLQDKYLVIGRNRREDENSAEAFGRRVMGRKGIGKLSGFGIATRMTVITWKGNESFEITLDLALLNQKPGDSEPANKKIIGFRRNGLPIMPFGQQNSGTRIILSNLKQASPIGTEELHEALSRRFSRTVQGRMQIYLNRDKLHSFNISIHPKSRKFEDGEITDTIDGNTVTYNYVFTDKPIRENELRGWTIQVNGKTAQRPNFFFNVDVNGTSQHSSKYLCGYIEADYLDKGIEDETDFVSTDRQEIDWERVETKSLWEWGRRITQKIFTEIAERNAEENMNVILSDDQLKRRIDALDPTSQSKVTQFVRSIGSIKITSDDENEVDKIKVLGDQIIKAFEYRHFIDVIEDIEAASIDNPEELQALLFHLSQWEVLESRSILEVIKGRIIIVDKLHSLVANNAPETPNRGLGKDNLHDLIAGFPWLLNPEWQILDEEKTITRQLKEWGETEIQNAENRERYDYLGLKSDGKLVIIEIKRSGHPVELEEVQRLERYRERLSRTHSDITCVLIYGGNNNLSASKTEELSNSEHFKLVTWEEIYHQNHTYYSHYRAVLEGHLTHSDFSKKEVEVQKVRQVISSGSVYRTKEERRTGLGPQDRGE